MADNREILIRIKPERASGSQDSSSTPTTSSGETNKAVGSGLNNGFDRYAALTLVSYAAKTAINDIVQVASNELGWYFRLSEDYKNENDYQNTMNVIGKFGSAATNILGGAATGAMVGGPWGAVIGGAIATVHTGVSMGLSAVNTQRTQSMQIASRGFAIEFNKSLAGVVSLESRGTED